MITTWLFVRTKSRDGSGDSMIRTPGYEPCTWFGETTNLLEKRILKPTFNVVTPVEVLANAHDRCRDENVDHNACGFPSFPVLNHAVLSTAPNSTTRYPKGNRLHVFA